MKLLFLTNILTIIFLQVVSEKITTSTEIMIEETCPEFMSLFSRDDNSTYFICDCSFKTHLYFSEKNSCSQSYMQGPCLLEHYLVLPLGENLAKCEKNPCLEDGLVSFRGKCAHLFKRGSPCSLSTSLSIKPDTFQLYCSARSLNVIKAPEKKCPLGSRRNALGACKHAF